MADQLSLGFEYRHTDLGQGVYTTPTTPIGPVSPGVYTGPPGATASLGGAVFPAPATIHHTDDAVTFRINLRFGR